MPMDQLMNPDVEYQVVNDQMQFIVKDVQAPEATTAAWLVGMDPVTTNCSDLAETLRGYSQFHNLPIHVKVQQLKIEKTDKPYAWGHPERVDVVTIQCANHLRKTTVKALIKTFNSTKPRGVQNRPNGTNAKCVEWWGDRNSPIPIKSELNTAKLAKGKHREWLDYSTHHIRNGAGSIPPNRNRGRRRN